MHDQDLTHHLASLLAVHLVPMALSCMVGCFVWFLLWLGSHANLSMLNETWLGPVGETSQSLQQGRAFLLFRVKSTIYTIANTGAMLLIGQERSRDSAALVVESCCDPIVTVVTKAADSRRVSGSYNRRERGGRLPLTENIKPINSFLWRQLTASGPSPNVLLLSPACPHRPATDRLG
jgi:hypothetical protein